MDPKPLTRKERRVAASYRKIQKAKEKASAEYERADRETLKLANLLGGHGATARISQDGKGIKIVEPLRAALESPKLQAGQMPKAWAHAAVRQFDVEELKLVPTA
jgi:hypothetical protein